MGGYQYLTESVQKKLRKIAHNVQNGINALEPPINYNDLYENAKLTKHVFDTDMLAGSGLIKDVDSIKKTHLRGILSVKEKQVFVIDSTNYQKRHNFILAHEFGHWQIPSHNALLFHCSQFDLSRAAQKQLEQEANFFAGELGFMGKLFFEHLMSSDLTIDNLKKLSDLFGFSIEATLIRAVHTDLRPCAIRSMKLKKKNGQSILETKYLIHSIEFEKQVGELNHTSIYKEDHVISSIINDPIKCILNDNKFQVTLKGTEHKLDVELWKNDWSAFALYTVPGKASGI